MTPSLHAEAGGARRDYSSAAHDSPAHPRAPQRSRLGVPVTQQRVRKRRRQCDRAGCWELVAPVRMHDGSVAPRQHERVAGRAQVGLLALDTESVRVVGVDLLERRPALCSVENTAPSLCTVHRRARRLLEHGERRAGSLVLQLVSDGHIDVLLPQRMQRSDAFSLALDVWSQSLLGNLVQKVTAAIQFWQMLQGRFNRVTARTLSPRSCALYDSDRFLAVVFLRQTYGVSIAMSGPYAPRAASRASPRGKSSGGARCVQSQPES